MGVVDSKETPDAEAAEVTQKPQKFLNEFFRGFCEVFAASASGC
jgi:hypothetical protein